MSLEEILGKFGEALQTAYGAIGASHAQPEDQLKHPVVQLMQELGNVLGVEIVATTEAAMVELKGRPDVAMAVNGAVTGHVELKAPGKGAQPRHSARRHRRWAGLRSCRTSDPVCQ